MAFFYRGTISLNLELNVWLIHLPILIGRVIHEYPADKPAISYFHWLRTLLSSNLRTNLRSIIFQANEADDPKAEDGIIPSGNKHEAGRNRATDAGAKFRNPSSAANSDRESEDVSKNKRIKYEDKAEDKAEDVRQ